MGSELGAFWSTWQKARDTFGEGTPQEGSPFDASSQLDQASSDISSAAPASSWIGDAATAYDGKNTKHAQNLTRFAALDRRLSTQITNSANVVAAGRQNLDTIGQWVTDAAANVPDTRAGDQQRLVIASRGLGEVADVIQRSNGDLNDIGRRIQALDQEYQALGDDKPLNFGPDGTGEAGTEDGEEDGEPTEEEIKEQAESDVHDVLNGGGDPVAPTRVENVLNSIQPGQPLSTEQGAYLSQMQGQQKGMTLDQLKAAEDRLGGQGHVIGDSWQLMSDTDVQLPGDEIPAETMNDPVAKAQYYESKLPDSVLHALNREGLDSWSPLHDPVEARTNNARDVSTIADIVGDGQDRFQQGTALDDAMLDWSRETMADPTNGGGLLSPFGLDGYNEYADARDDALSDVFTTAGVDHQAVSAELGGSTGQQFLTELHTHVWAETDDMSANQASTHSLLAWIGDEAHSSNDAEATRAGVAAHALAVNLDANHDQYLKPDAMPGMGATPNAANLNPSLIGADAIALEPYQDAMVGDPSGVKGFEALSNSGDGNLDAARNIFAVIDSDPGAATMFNAAAEEKILAHQQAFADAVGAGPPAITDTSSGDLKRAAYLLGVVNGGAEIEATARGLQAHETAQAVYDLKKSALDYLFDQVPNTGKIPGIDMGRGLIETGILGVGPELAQADPNVQTYTAQHAINATYYQMASELDIRPGDIDPKYFDGPTLKSPDQFDSFELDEYSTALENFLKAQGYPETGSNFDRYYENAAGK